MVSWFWLIFVVPVGCCLGIYIIGTESNLEKDHDEKKSEIDHGQDREDQIPDVVIDILSDSDSGCNHVDESIDPPLDISNQKQSHTSLSDDEKEWILS